MPRCTSAAATCPAGRRDGSWLNAVHPPGRASGLRSVTLRAAPFQRAGVAKLADARDSKSRAGHPACGFDSLLRHHLSTLAPIHNLRVSDISIRAAVTDDAVRIAAIYAPYVERTAVSFEYIAPPADDVARRIEKCLTRWQWLVAEIDGQVAGYAYGSQHRERPAYRWSVEVSAYVDSRYQRRGIGAALYAALLDDLARKGFCHAFAGITLPNAASVGLHTHMGFSPIGVFASIGWKFGQWHDVAWFQRKLRDRPPAE